MYLKMLNAKLVTEMFDCLIFDKFLKYAMSNNPDYTGKY